MNPSPRPARSQIRGQLLEQLRDLRQQPLPLRDPHPDYYRPLWQHFFSAHCRAGCLDSDQVRNRDLAPENPRSQL